MAKRLKRTKKNNRIMSEYTKRLRNERRRQKKRQRQADKKNKPNPGSSEEEH